MLGTGGTVKNGPDVKHPGSWNTLQLRQSVFTVTEAAGAHSKHVEVVGAGCNPLPDKETEFGEGKATC